MKLFISRTLAKDSIFRQKVEEIQAIDTITDCSLVEFSPISFQHNLSADWLFFYSKNGIQFCLSQLDDLSSLPKIAVIGPASADFLANNWNLQADFVGTGHPEATAEAFLKVAEGKQVLFAQAKNSKQSVQKILGTAVQAVDLVVYDNVIKTDFTIPFSEMLVFTSPLNVKAYFSKYTFEPRQKVVSIGRTTAKALDEFEITNYIIAAKPNELALAKACIGGF